MKRLIDDAIEYQVMNNSKNILNNISERIDSNCKMEIEVPQKIIRVNPYLDLSTKEVKKKYRFVYDKRRIIPDDYSTLPFGFKQ